MKRLDGKPPRRRWTTEEKEEIRRRVSAGETQTEVARSIGTTQGCISHILMTNKPTEVKPEDSHDSAATPSIKEPPSDLVILLRNKIYAAEDQIVQLKIQVAKWKKALPLVDSR
jgi:transposase-like protein